MLILFAVGVMSIVWMLVVAALIFAEKVLPVGERLSRAFAIGFVAVGIWVAAAPSSVPGLTQPGSPQAMQAMRAMGMHGIEKDAGTRPANSMGMQRTHSMGMQKATPMKMK